MSMSYENTIREIDNDYDKIKDFDNESLFFNIYHFWCFAAYLSPYYIWGRTFFNLTTCFKSTETKLEKKVDNRFTKS